jgi:hypothetical protein
MKLKFTITFENEILDLSHYEATTLQEAVENQTKWLKEGAIGVLDLVESAVEGSIKLVVEGEE